MPSCEPPVSNGAPEDSIQHIPKDLLRVKVETSPDLVAISKTIKSGIEVPGAHLEERQDVNIK